MNKTKAPQGRFSLFSGLCLSLYPVGSREGFPRLQHTSFEHVVEVPACVDILILCHLRIFASQLLLFLAAKFALTCTIFCRNEIHSLSILSIDLLLNRRKNVATLRTDDNVCASIAWFFIVKTIKEKKAANFGWKSRYDRRIIVCFFYHPFCMRGAKRLLFCDAANCRKPGAGR